jgi:hypothetical protein
MPHIERRETPTKAMAALKQNAGQLACGIGSPSNASSSTVIGWPATGVVMRRGEKTQPHCKRLKDRDFATTVFADVN